MPAFRVRVRASSSAKYLTEEMSQRDTLFYFCISCSSFCNIVADNIRDSNGQDEL